MDVAVIEPLGVFVLGLIIGSFSNVVIFRLPLGRSIISPGSHCRACKTPIRPWDNIPLLSYLLLKGRCRVCREQISPYYPAIELTSGVLYILLWFKFGLSLPLIAYALFSSALLVVALIDLDHQIIPDIITLPGMALGLALSPWTLISTPFASLIGALAAGLFFYIVAIVSKGGMGGGDIKLIAMIGAFLGWQGAFFTILVGALTGSVVGITLMMTNKKGRKDKIPFGPYLSFAAILFTLLGNNIIHWYIRQIL
jgi:leader peptidase (prepilin peptidase)/N-methyltransferase